jgi:hypothetical protein
MLISPSKHLSIYLFTSTTGRSPGVEWRSVQSLEGIVEDRRKVGEFDLGGNGVGDRIYSTEKGNEQRGREKRHDSHY